MMRRTLTPLGEALDIFDIGSHSGRRISLQRYTVIINKPPHVTSLAVAGLKLLHLTEHAPQATGIQVSGVKQSKARKKHLHLP